MYMYRNLIHTADFVSVYQLKIKLDKHPQTMNAYFLPT